MARFECQMRNSASPSDALLGNRNRASRHRRSFARCIMFFASSQDPKVYDAFVGRLLYCPRGWHDACNSPVPHKAFKACCRTWLRLRLDERLRADSSAREGTRSKSNAKTSALAWARRCPFGLGRSPPNLPKPGAFLFSEPSPGHRCPKASNELELKYRGFVLVPIAHKELNHKDTKTKTRKRESADSADVRKYRGSSNKLLLLFS